MEHARIDFIVAGAGASGLSAATTLARKGYRVVVVEARPWAGGMLAYLNTMLPNGYHSLEYAVKILRRALDNGVEVRTSSTLEPCGAREACIRGGKSIVRVKPLKGILLATGVTETPWAWLGIETDARLYGLVPSSSFLAAVNLLGYTMGRKILVYGCDWHAISSARIAAKITGKAILVHNCPLPGKLVEKLEEENITLVEGVVRRAEAGNWRIEKIIVSTREKERKTIEADTLVYSFTKPSPLTPLEKTWRGIRVRRIGGSKIGGEDTAIHSSHAVKIGLELATGSQRGGESKTTSWKCVARTHVLGKLVYATGSCTPFQHFYCDGKPAGKPSWASNTILCTSSCRRVAGAPSDYIPAQVLRETSIAVEKRYPAQIAGARIAGTIEDLIPRGSTRA